VEQYVRVASPDIEAKFPKPLWNMTGKEHMGHYLADYGAKPMAMEQAEQEYRERAKVWWRAKEEEKRLRDEKRAEQAQVWQEEKMRQIQKAAKRRE
jgi:hypothetical protein